MAVPFSNPESASKRDPKHDKDKERWRLAWLYADMTDGEIESLAAESSSLTEVARRALQSELYRRGFPVRLREPADAARATLAGAATAGAAGQTGSAKSRGLVIVRRFRDMPEALLAISILESAGIECLLDDANIIRTDWLWSNLLGGVKLRVRVEELEEAASLLDQGLLAREPAERFAVLDARDFEPPRCPRCQSPDVSLDVPAENSRPPVSALSVFAIAAPAESGPGWRCQSCGNQWRELEPTG